MSLLSNPFDSALLCPKPGSTGWVYPIDPISKPVLLYLGKALFQWIRSWSSQRYSADESTAWGNEPMPDGSYNYQQTGGSLLGRIGRWLRSFWTSARTCLSVFAR